MIARADRRVRPRRRRRRGARGHRHRRRPRLLRGRRPRRRAASTFDGGPGRSERPEDHRDGGGLVTLRIFDMKKPVIAAINGPAVGFGVTMTLPMDIRLASSAAQLGFVFARRGVVPEACSTWFLPRLVGIAQAAEWAYTGACSRPRRRCAAGWSAAWSRPHALLPAARDAGPRDRRQHLRGLGRAHPPDAVADARRRPSDGGAPARLARHVRTRAGRPTRTRA